MKGPGKEGALGAGPGSAEERSTEEGSAEKGLVEVVEGRGDGEGV